MISYPRDNMVFNGISYYFVYINNRGLLKEFVLLLIKGLEEAVIINPLGLSFIAESENVANSDWIILIS
jgi:hypothetical protein